jgi:cell division protease FtsH
MVMTEQEKMLTAYHEGGHAILALNVAATDPVHKATIIPRGRALGMVMQLPERNKLSMSYEQMTSRISRKRPKLLPRSARISKRI